MKKYLLLLFLFCVLCSVGALAQMSDGGPRKASYNGHEYVDLGLPSGTLWATTNVGATNPEDYGDYFAWGETSPKSNYDWSTYKWCNGSSTTLTKYCNDSYFGYNGFTDTLTELEIADDAANAIWGNNWRIPSLTQFQELIDNRYTTTEWATLNGVYGLKIISKMPGHEDKFIFLPPAGERYDTSLDLTEWMGWYQSRTLCTHYNFGSHEPYDNWIMWFVVGEEGGILAGSNGSGESANYRWAGCSIRPVRFFLFVDRISLNPSSLTLAVDETAQLTATVTPSNADNLALTWSSSNESVVTVSSTGLVTAVAAGTCTVTCAATDGSGVKATCQVTVPSSAVVEPYAVLSTDGTTLTFYYDKNKNTRTGTIYTKDEFRTSNVDGWGTARSTITSVYFDSSFAEYDGLTNTAYWFSSMGINTINGIENLNTSNVTNMYGMFASCPALTSLDLTHFDTSKVTNMNLMFGGCLALTNLDLSHFDTSEVTDMGYMFAVCSSLKTILIGTGWNTDNVTISDEMFYGCTNLVGGDGTTFDPNYTDKTKAYAGIGGYLTMATYPGLPDLTLDEDVDNTGLLETYDGETTNVTLKRTLQPGGWNTFCVPFAMDAAMVVDKLGTEAVVKQLDHSVLDGDVLTLYFVDATAIEAGRAYLVSVVGTLADPVFEGVTVSKYPVVTETAYADFVPALSPVVLRSGDKKSLFVVGGNTLTFPSETSTLKSFRGYFHLHDVPAGVRLFNMDFENTWTGVESLDASPATDEWYTLDGRKLSGKPVQKGIYVKNGCKVMVK